MSFGKVLFWCRSFVSKTYIHFYRARLLAKVTDRSARADILISDPFLPIYIESREGAVFALRGKLSFDTWNRNREPVFIKLGEGSSLTINGDFMIGGGTRIILSRGASLFIGGQRNESGSGITERSLVMVKRRIHIGSDLACAWGVFITDCDWHTSGSVSNVEDTIIGDHVWIAPNCSILKGSKIGSGSMVATGTITHRNTFPEDCLIAGAPARVAALNRKWCRDMEPLS